MIALSVAKLKMFSPESEIFLWIKPKKKNFSVESLDQCRRLKVREHARSVFLWRAYVCLTTWCYTTSHLHQVFFPFRSDFLAFFSRISNFKLLEFKEFNKTIIPFALVGYETGYSTRRYAPRWLFTISYPTRAHGIILNSQPRIMHFAYSDWFTQSWLSAHIPWFDRI